MSKEFLEHLPPFVQIIYWIGLGAALVLMSTVYKAVWRALGYLCNRKAGPPSAQDYPLLWREPESPTFPNPAVDRVADEGGGRRDRRPARKRR